MEGHRLPSLFKTPQAKRFEFKPRYYNEVKERIEKQERMVLKELEYEKSLDSNPELQLRDKIKNKWNVNSRKEATQRSNKRVIMIAMVLGMLAYYFLLR